MVGMRASVTYFVARHLGYDARMYDGSIVDWSRRKLPAVMGRLTWRNSDLLQGTLDLLILKTLALGPQHGWGISQRIQQISENVLRVNQGSLYPAFSGSIPRVGSNPSGAPPKTTGRRSSTDSRGRVSAS